mmetsp:Transcript_28107/g.61708  ORF Transcript_28107/g.61708 Transcript_28107/m.61708 type:complete len:99 (+) Transcript_28107:566-862(+)
MSRHVRRVGVASHGTPHTSGTTHARSTLERGGEYAVGRDVSLWDSPAGGVHPLFKGRGRSSGGLVAASDAAPAADALGGGHHAPRWKLATSQRRSNLD